MISIANVRTISVTEMPVADSRVELLRGVGLTAKAVEQNTCTVVQMVAAGTVWQQLDGRVRPVPA